MTIPIIAADGTKKTVPLAAPAVSGNPYPNAGVWTGGTVTDTWQDFTNCTGAFVPAWAGPKPAGNSHMVLTTTPFGPGYSITVTDSDTAIWNSSCRAILVQGSSSATSHDTLGTVCQYTVPLYLPTQAIVNNGFSGLLWELHTNATTAHNVSLDTHTAGTPANPVWWFNVQNDSGGTGTASYKCQRVAFDTWHQVVIQIYWTETASGFMRFFVDGVLQAAYTGQTYWASFGVPYMQFGWYSVKPTGGLTNTIQFGPVVRRQLASGLP